MQNVPWRSISAKLFNMQTGRRAYANGEAHYDLGNDLYERMLDKRLTYSCGYWKDAADLDEAQEAKLDLVCAKLDLKPGMKVLDIGGGWGSFAKFAAERHDANVVAYTVSEEQAKLGRELCRGLPVEFRRRDYREIGSDEKFDRVLSIGMFEHVGRKNHRAYFDVVRRALKDDGLQLLHTIGTTISGVDPWIDKYIFPNAHVPSAAEIVEAVGDAWVIEDWHNFGTDYDATLMAWHRNLVGRWREIERNYDERFKRMWTYYLLSCAGGFRARRSQVWQLVASKSGVRGGYRSIR